MYSASKLGKIGAAWLAAMLVLVGIAGATSVSAAGDNVEAANSALTWMKSQQQPDGSFAGFGAGSTIDALLAILAAGQDPASYSQNGNTPVTFLESKAGDLAKTPGGAGKLLLAVSALGDTGRPFGPNLAPLGGPKNLIAAIEAAYDPSTGHYGKDTIGHAFAMLGLAKFGGPRPKAAQYLESVQAADGGWSFSGDTKAGASDTNTTAVALQALIAVGGADPLAIKKAVTYLDSQQNADGGFPYQKGGGNGSESDANSIAYVTQASLALGNETTARKGIAFLLSLQKPDGAFQYQKSQPDDNAGATYQAVPAILGATLVRSLPVQAAPAIQPAPGMPRTGGGGIDGIDWTAGVIALGALLLSIGLLVRRESPTP